MGTESPFKHVKGLGGSFESLCMNCPLAAGANTLPIRADRCSRIQIANYYISFWGNYGIRAKPWP